MKIDLRKLAGNYGGCVPFEGTANLDDDESFPKPVTYSGEIRNHLGILRLTGTIKATYSTCCARCLEPLEIPLEAGTDTLLTYDESAVESEDEVFLLEGEEVEVEEILIPALLLQIEMVYLCRPDCKGLCPVCGADRNQQDCGCAEKKIDPRLAVLGALLEKGGE